MMNSTARFELINNEELSIILTGKDDKVFADSPLLSFVKNCFAVIKQISEINDVDRNFLTSIRKHKSEDIQDISIWLEEEGIEIINNLLIKPIYSNEIIEPFIKRYNHILKTGFLDAVDYNDYHSFYLSFLDAIYGVDDQVNTLEFSNKLKENIITSTIYLSGDLQNYDLQNHFWIDIAKNSHISLTPAKEAGFFYEER